MKFLADESCDFSIVKALRQEGHHVQAICEMRPGVSDEDVIALAVSQKRILLTEDKDFGQLAHASGTTGIILRRFPAGARSGMAASVLELVHQKGEQLPLAFAVVQPGRTRLIIGSV